MVVYDDMTMLYAQSELNFGFDEWIHLVHVAGQPHQPHRYGAYYNGDQRNSILIHSLLLVVLGFPQRR